MSLPPTLSLTSSTFSSFSHSSPPSPTCPTSPTSPASPTSPSSTFTQDTALHPSAPPSINGECSTPKQDPIYDLDDENVLKTLDFRPWKVRSSSLELISKLPRFKEFRTLNPTELRDRKRVAVPESTFKLPTEEKDDDGNPIEYTCIPVYKGQILEKRQQPLTGKETFNVFEVYTIWEENNPRTAEKQTKEVCIRWDMENGRVQLYALVYMVHPNKKAESGKFLEANNLVELSMIPHKDNPKKVATGGNWAGQGYWVPYVVALHYARNWCHEFRYLLAFLWGDTFPSSCKAPGDAGYRDNTLDARVIAAAKRDSDHFKKLAAAAGGAGIAAGGTVSTTTRRSANAKKSAPANGAGTVTAKESAGGPDKTKGSEQVIAGPEGAPTTGTQFYDPVRESTKRASNIPRSTVSNELLSSIANGTSEQQYSAGAGAAIGGRKRKNTNEYTLAACRPRRMLSGTDMSDYNRESSLSRADGAQPASKRLHGSTFSPVNSATRKANTADNLEEQRRQSWNDEQDAAVALLQLGQAAVIV